MTPRLTRWTACSSLHTLPHHHNPAPVQPRLGNAMPARARRTAKKLHANAKGAADAADAAADAADAAAPLVAAIGPERRAEGAA